jgi:hypothetical protein
VFMRPQFQLAVLATLITLYSAPTARAADAPPPPAKKSPAAAKETPPAPSLSPRQKIEQALDKQISIDFIEAPLSDVVAFLRDQLKIDIQIDLKALQDAGAGLDTPATRTLNGITARSALRHLLGSLDLDYAIVDDVLLITTPEKVFSHLRTEVYAVEDLIAGTNEFGEAIEDYRTLINIITSAIDPTAWDEVGGPGSIQGLQGNLIVSQIDPHHRHVAELIARIRQLKQLPADAPLPAPIQIGGSNTPADQAVRAALQRKLTLEFDEAPLSEVCLFLRNQLKIEVQLDTRALQDAGYDADTPVTVKIADLRAASALNLMLKQIDLVYIVKDEVLLITTPEKASSELTSVLLPVRDLLDPALPPIDSLEQLSAVISTTVQPTVWDEVGGPSSIVPVAVAQSLMISATDPVLTEVTDLLSSLRKNRGNRKSTSPPSPVSKMQTRIYKLKPQPPKPDSIRKAESPKAADASKILNTSQAAPPTAASPAIPPAVAQQPTPEEVAQLLQRLVEPASWQNTDRYVLILGDQLIIRQTSLLHRRIKQLLSKLEVLAPEPSYYAGGGGGYF